MCRLYKSLVCALDSFDELASAVTEISLQIKRIADSMEKETISDKEKAEIAEQFKALDDRLKGLAEAKA